MISQPSNDEQEAKKKAALEKQKIYLEHCMTAYNMYAKMTPDSQDAFYNGYKGEFKETQGMLKKISQKMRQEPAKHLDVMAFNRDPKNLNLRKNTFYGVNGKVSYLIEPASFTKNIGRVYSDGRCAEYVNKPELKDTEESIDSDESIDIHVFEGVTGAINGKLGNKSPMGYVSYNRKTKEITVVFRGSRSGDGFNAALKGLLLRGGNPDWVTDMQSVGCKAKENLELSKVGKFQDGFAQTYLSCREGIVDAITAIQKSDPDAKPTLVTTGHSLGGGLANALFIDAKKGSLGNALKAASAASSESIESLVKGCECYTFSAPPICDETVNKQFTAEEKKQFHRSYCEHDIVKNNVNLLVGGGTALGFIDGCENISLGGPKGTAIAHEPYTLYKRIQEELGSNNREIGAYKLDSKNLKILNDDAFVRESKQLTEQQMANLALQFNEEHFFAMAYQKFYAENLLDKKEGELLAYIEQLSTTLSSNPFSQNWSKKLGDASKAEQFEGFKQALTAYLRAIEETAIKSPTLQYLAYNTRRLLENYQKTTFEALEFIANEEVANEMQNIEKPAKNTATNADNIISNLQYIASSPNDTNTQKTLIKELTQKLLNEKFPATVEFLHELAKHEWSKQPVQVSADISRKIRLCVKIDELGQKMADLNETDTEKVKAIKEEITKADADFQGDKIIAKPEDKDKIEKKYSNLDVNSDNIAKPRWMKESVLKKNGVFISLPEDLSLLKESVSNCGALKTSMMEIINTNTHNEYNVTEVANDAHIDKAADGTLHVTEFTNLSVSYKQDGEDITDNIVGTAEYQLSGSEAEQGKLVDISISTSQAPKMQSLVNQVFIKNTSFLEKIKKGCIQLFKNIKEAFSAKHNPAEPSIDLTLATTINAKIS